MWPLSIRNWFDRRNTSIQTRKTRRARTSCKLRLEHLEERVCPTVTVSYDPTSRTLDVYAANSTSAPATITLSTATNAVAIQTTGDTMTLGNGTSSSFNLDSSGQSLQATVVVANLTISGPNGTTDTADTVNLNNVLLYGAPHVYHLIVSAGTINIAAGAKVTAGLFNSSASLTAETISIGTGAQVQADAVSMTSVNSLILQATGVPYLGSLTVHDAPSAGQPFADDPYITGPDWGTYGYAAGDMITISNVSTLASGPYTVKDIVGDNMYLDSSYQDTFTSAISPYSSETFTNVAVQCTGFTPQVEATNLTLDVTGAGSTITGAIQGYGQQTSGSSTQYVVLSATTAGGNINIQEIPVSITPLGLESLNAGTGTIQLTVNGSILPATALDSSLQPATNLIASEVVLTSTGSGSSIGSSSNPITTQSGVAGQSLTLTAATNDGPVYVQDSSSAGLTVDSVVADQGGEAPTLSNGEVVYNSTPASSTPTYISGSNGVTISSTGPIALNSVSATGAVSISGQYILEGSARSPTVITPSVDLVASGTADYQGQATFAPGSSGDTLTLPAGDTWSQFGFAAGQPIVVSGASASADDGTFTIASLSGATLTLTASYVLTPETDALVTVGDGVIGQASTPVSLSSVPLFDATTNNGTIYLEVGIDSTAEYVSAGSAIDMNGTPIERNGVSVTSQASYLTIENITATGEAAVAANSGSLVEYDGGNTTVNGNSVSVPGLITGQTVSLTSPYNVGTASSPIYTDATIGLTVDATATSPSSAGIDINNVATSALTAIGVSTYDGSVSITFAGGSLSFSGGVLSEAGNALVTFANTDSGNGSDGDVIVRGMVYVISISAGIATDGTAGAGQILTNSGTINGDNAAVVLSAGSGVGVSGTPLYVTNVQTLAATTSTGDIYLTNGTSAASPLTLSATTLAGNIDVTWNGDIDLASEISSTSGAVLNSISATRTVTLVASGAIADMYNSTVYARTLVLTATAGIGTTGSPLETSSPGTLTVTATAGTGLFLDSSAALAVDSASGGNGDLSISSTGNVTLAGNVSGDNVSLTATAGTVTATAGTVTATAGNLAITAEQIGSRSNVIQTNATTLNATANYGGIYLSNDNSNTLTLTAGAVGTSSSAAAPNNAVIYSAGNIVLQQQTTSLTQLATSLPVALFTPGGELTLFAGDTLSADGETPTTVNSSATITSASTTATATSTLDVNGYGEVTSVSLGTSGTGYKTAPTVTFSGGGGSGATATATINAQGQVTGITITNAGSGYTSAPTVTLSAPGDDIYTGTYNLNGTTAVTSSSPSYLQSLVIVSNTAEVAVSNQGGSSVIPALITLADLTSLASHTNGNGTVAVANGTETVATTTSGTTTVTTVTIEAGAITIADLGQNGSAGTAMIPYGWSLVLDATDGSIVFLNLGDTIKTTLMGTITVTAGTSTTDVAALGNLTTGGGNITISAGGNIAVGTLAAGKTSGTLGTIAVTSTTGAILVSSPTTPTFTASSTTLTEAAQPVYSSQSAALAELNATEVIAAADAASAQAVATVAAAGAQAAAELALVNSLQAALTSIQGAVTTDNQTYQADAQITNTENTLVTDDTTTVNNLTTAVTTATGIAADEGLSSAGENKLGALASLTAALGANIPVIGYALNVLAAGINVFAAFDGLASARANEDAYNDQVKLNAASTTLSNDSSTLSTDQFNEAQAYAQLQADMDTETALTAAYDIAQQAYTASEQTYTNDQTISAQVQAQGDTAQALAIANVVYAASPQPITATGSGPVSIQALSPLTVSASVTSATAVNLAAAADLPSTAPDDNLTVNSGVTVESTGSGVTLFAGDNVDVESGATIEAVSPITITANGYDQAGGATVTLAGTLDAPSASIGVDPGATGNETFNITPSATTPISVDGGSDSGGVNTLNINADGLPVTISGNTITVGSLAPVTFANIQDVNITNEAGNSLTLDGKSGSANTLSLVGTAQEAGTATLNSVAFSFTNMTSFSYQGGAGDTIAVMPYENSSLPWNLAVTVAGSSSAPASLTYASLASSADLVTPTGANSGTISSPGLASVRFSNVGALTINASQSAGDQLTVNLSGTSGKGVVNTLAAEQTAPSMVAFTLGAFSAPFSMSSIGYGSVSLSDTTATALFEVGVAAALETNPTASVNFSVLGSPVYNDHLLVKDEGGAAKGSSDVLSPSGIAGSGQATVGALNPVSYQNIGTVKFLPTVTVTDAGGAYKGKPYAATAQVNGGASLNGVKPTLSYYSYSGTFTPTVNYYTGTFTPPTGAVKLSGAPFKVGTYAVVASFAGTGIYAPNWAYTTFTISQARHHVSAQPLLSITGFSPGTPVAGGVLPSQNLSVAGAGGGTATASIEDTTTGVSDVLGTVAVKNGVLALKNMTIPASFGGARCRLVVTLDGLVWTSSDFEVATGHA